MNRKSVFVLIAIVLPGAIALGLYLTSDGRIIKKRFALLAEAICKEAGEKPITTGIQAKNLEPLFGGSCTFSVEEHGLTGTFTRDEIVRYAPAARLRFTTIDLTFTDFSMEYPSDGSAVVSVTARFIGSRGQAGEMDEIIELEVHLRESEEGWVFTDFTAVDVLEK